MQRSSLLLLLLVSVAYAYLIVPVHAQSVTVSNLQYPSTILLNKPISVSFTAVFSGGSGYYLVVGIWDKQRNNYAYGSLVSSSPDSCTVTTTFNWAASCVYSNTYMSQGSENLVFSLSNLSSVGTYSFYAVAGFVSSSGNVIATNGFSNPFSLSIINQFTLTVNVPSPVLVSLDGMSEMTPGSIAPQLSPGMHSISVPDTVKLDSTSRLVFVGWSDGSNQTTRTFDLESDTQITGNYVTQYFVNSTTDSTLKSGWYNSGSNVAFTVVQTSWNSYRIFVGGFDGWYSNGQLASKSVRASLSINGPVVIRDQWNFYPYLPPIIIVAIVCGIAALVVTGSLKTLDLPKLKTLKRSKKRTRRSKPKPEALTTDTEKQTTIPATTEPAIVKTETAAPKTEALTPEIQKRTTATQAIEKTQTETPATLAKTTMYCTQCGAVISRDSKFCKECGTKL